jgi:hypothetical protein
MLELERLSAERALKTVAGLRQVSQGNVSPTVTTSSTLFGHFSE